jgi:hypothetical protein
MFIELAKNIRTALTSGQRKSMTLVVMEAINLILKENREPLTTWRD